MQELKWRQFTAFYWEARKKIMLIKFLVPLDNNVILEKLDDLSSDI